MDPVKNPYVPGAGSPPPELAGRSLILSDANVALERIKLGKSSRSMILVGLRGVGKTVLLVRMKEIADNAGYRTIMVEAHESKSLQALIVPSLRQILFSLDIIENAKTQARKGLRILKSFVRTFKVTVGEIDLGLSIEPERGTGDSGDLEVDLGELFVAVADAAKAANKPILMLIDELQYLSEVEFSALIMAIHKINQHNFPFLLIGAGLPQILALAGASKSYSERLFSFPEIGALAVNDAIDAIAKPAKEEGVVYTSGAIARILNITERYPYFLQQWGHEAWNISVGPEISEEDIEKATEAAIKTLDNSFFKVRFDRCTPSEKRYMRALAELGIGSHRSGDIAEILDLKTTSVAPTRSKLIQKGMIYSPSHGDTAFTVPLFDGYMRRAMPNGVK
jgi:AAA ATPase domain